jgi:hypothetical protein
MALSDVLASIDHEIAQLQMARALLTGRSQPTAKRKPGRPRKTQTELAAQTAKPKRGKKRTLSAEGRKLISEAAKRRWAAQRKATS